MNVIGFSAMLVFANAAPILKDINLGGLLKKKDPGEFGKYFEGDMLLNKEQTLAVSDAIYSRNGLKDSTKRWPEKTVVYHIAIDNFDEDEKKMIEEAMAEIVVKSCIKFRPKEGDEHAVVIKSTSNGCFSNVGYNTLDDQGEEEDQVLNLAKGCFRHGTIVHEMLHTLGFYHMQSTYDRDEYVIIVWENIKSGTEHNFAKYNTDTITDFEVEYDYGSVMHYPEKAFSKNGNNTIIPLQKGVQIGQRIGMSERDLLKLNKMYCEEESVTNILFRDGKKGRKYKNEILYK